ncbi:stage III sporulation protein AF [Alicyclobacillus pomorum]|uniref:stage III sporulation protein AF n=1 Tax=Alicyclobacillus pomorum TaxID=204470 RepID=UPI0004155EEB|nr:stage III sporulation protein AF [Alicyclobacillus pomorum]
MTALGEWLKQIVLVVLLAVFADLLLPTKATQKYVRTVMGLAIIAAILQPIIPLFQRNWADRVAQFATDEVFSNQSLDIAPAVPNVDSLKQVLKSQQDAEAANILGQQLKQQLASQFQCVPNSVEISGVQGGTDQLQVRVVVAVSDMPKAGHIQAWIAKELDISSEQVHVVTS